MKAFLLALLAVCFVQTASAQTASPQTNSAQKNSAQTISAQKAAPQPTSVQPTSTQPTSTQPTSAPPATAQPSLASWAEGPAKAAILAFVGKVTKEGSPDFVPVAERIATFDNDGTLWSEQPAYFQAMFILDRVKVLAPQHPDWQTREPFSSLLKGDLKAVASGGEQALVKLVAATHSGMTTDEFAAVVTDWLAKARHPKTGKLYTEMVYQPMLELLAYLRANGFKTYIVSGGGVEFVRAFSERVYGIPPEQVIGSSLRAKFELRNGIPVLVKQPDIFFIDDKSEKPVAIQHQIGRRPLAAFGNSDGDLAMLQWTAGASGLRLPVFIRHTDAEREWAYDRTSKIGRLDRGLDEAAAKGWLVVDMKRDWKRVFAFEN